MGDELCGISDGAAMMPRRLKSDQLALLREVVEKREPDLTYLVIKAEAGKLALSERRHLFVLIASEFAETGLKSGDEPSPRGERLEALLDVINRPVIFGE